MFVERRSKQAASRGGGGGQQDASRGDGENRLLVEGEGQLGC